MSAETSLAVETNGENESTESEFQKGVKHLCERGITKVPTKYVWPIPDRPNSGNGNSSASIPNLKLPIIDFSKLQGSNRSQAINSLKNACEKFGFFQVRICLKFSSSSRPWLTWVSFLLNFFFLGFDAVGKPWHSKGCNWKHNWCKQKVFWASIWGEIKVHIHRYAFTCEVWDKLQPE